MLHTEVLDASTQAPDDSYLFLFPLFPGAGHRDYVSGPRSLASGWGGPVGTRQEAGGRAVRHSSPRTMARLLDNIHDVQAAPQGSQGPLTGCCWYNSLSFSYHLLLLYFTCYFY